MSELKEFDFRRELSHPMTAITMEKMDCQQTTGIKFKIPILMSEVPGSKPTETKGTVRTSHIMNAKPIPSEKYETSNYVLLNVAQEFAFMCPRDENDIIEEGQEFIAVCMDGELQKIRIIGRNF